MTDGVETAGDRKLSPRERAWAYAFGVGICLAVVSPAFSAPTSDSFPLSTYPMFAYKRQKTRLYHVDALDRAGRRHRIPPELVANKEAMQAAQTVRRAVRGGPARMQLLCERVAQRLLGDPQYADLVRVRVVEGWFDSLGYFVGGSEAERMVVHAECAAPGTP